MSCDYAKLMALQTSQLSNLVADLDQQLKKFQLLPTKVQEEIGALSDLQISRYSMNSDTVRYNEPACPIPKDGSLAADHLEVHFDRRWSHEPKISAPVGNGSGRVRGTIADMLYQAQAGCHSVRFPLKNKSTLTTVLESHSENEHSESSSKAPAESYRASQFAILLGNCQALNSAANHGRHRRRMPATDVYALHAANSNVGGAAHSQHTLAEAQLGSELRRANKTATAKTPLLTDSLLRDQSKFFFADAPAKYRSTSANTKHDFTK